MKPPSYRKALQISTEETLRRTSSTGRSGVVALSVAVQRWHMPATIWRGIVMAVSFTERAATQVRAYLQERGGGLGIRLIVQSSECSGMAYRLVFVDEAEESDLVFESFNEKNYLDTKSLAWVDGTEIDFVQIGEQSGFAFNNPNAKSQCV